MAPISHPYDRGGDVQRLFFVAWDRPRQMKTPTSTLVRWDGFRHSAFTHERESGVPTPQDHIISTAHHVKKRILTFIEVLRDGGGPESEGDAMMLEGQQ